VPKPKPQPKPAVKTKPAAKPLVKSMVKELKSAKTTSKDSAAGITPKAAGKIALKSDKAAKVAVKAVKPTTKVKAKDSVKTTTAKTSKAPTPTSKAKGAPAPANIKPALPAPAPIATASVPARAGRPSSRLAQLTVPSMAQSVASTAAKASFTQTTSLPLIVPPLASTVKKDPKLANNWKTTPVERLTDAELIAMHDDEYMNDTQLAFFRRKLTQLKKDILSNAGETTEHLREDTVVVPDPADRATIEEEHALELRTRDRERKLLKKIEQSIARIDSGDYGYCDETGEPIGVGRLLARPTANLSLEAQQRRELKQKMFGD
jgi:DnaK suppressor protein